LTIPEVFRPALAKLDSLPEEAAEELISAVPSMAPALSPKSAASKLATVVKSVSSRDLTQIAAALMALSSVRVLNKVALPEFVEDVCTSLKAFQAPGIKDCAALKSRLLRLLESESLVLSAKASALQREHSNVLLDIRVISDVRPLFPDGPETALGAMLVHSLKLSYLHNGDSREFYVALDDNDLASLQKVISRAETKAKALKSIIAKAGLVDLDQE
jgi:hypothetical protein